MLSYFLSRLPFHLQPTTRHILSAETRRRLASRPPLSHTPDDGSPASPLANLPSPLPGYTYRRPAHVGYASYSRPRLGVTLDFLSLLAVRLNNIPQLRPRRNRPVDITPYPRPTAQPSSPPAPQPPPQNTLKPTPEQPPDPIPDCEPETQPVMHTSQNRMTSMDLRVGGKYRIGKKIGSGSFGELFRIVLKSSSRFR